MNNNIKKILYICIPMLVAFLTIAIVFGVVSVNKNNIYKSTFNSELMYFEIDYLNSTETLNSIPTDKEYQIKSEIKLYNVSHTSLEIEKITINFIEESNSNWEHIHDGFIFVQRNTEILISTIRSEKTLYIESVKIEFNNSTTVIYPRDVYIDLYGENNEIILESTIRAFTTLTLVFSLFSIFVLVATVFLIALYVDIPMTKNKKEKPAKKTTS